MKWLNTAHKLLSKSTNQAKLLLGEIFAIIFTCSQILFTNSELKYEYLGMALTLSAFLISIQIIAMSVERREKSISELLETTKNGLDELKDKSRDIKIFDNTYEGLRHCIKSTEKANRILNTALINGCKFISTQIYQEWVDARSEFLIKNENSLKDLISAHYKIDDKPRALSEIPQYNSNYAFRFIDDEAFPLLQFTIFEYTDEKEVIFGWQLPDQEDGKCFMTTNKDIVDYFEKYFWHYYDNKTQPFPSIVLPTIKDKCYDSMKPGLWLYLLYDNPDYELNKAYGIIKITDTGDLNIKNKYKANAKVWYYGNRKRGEWHSINFEYVPLTQKLHIQYDIKIESPTFEEQKRGISEYTGYLHFEIYEDIHKTLTGHFKDLAQNDKKGFIKVKAYLDKDNKKIQNDIKEEDMQTAFFNAFNVDITNPDMYNTTQVSLPTAALSASKQALN